MSPKAKEPPPGPIHTILLVEDNHEVRAMLSETLRDLGFSVVDVADAESALEPLRNQPVDLLLSDIMISGLPEGARLARTCRLERPGTPVVLMSGSPERADVRIEDGICHAILVKPFRREALETTLRGLLSRP